MFRTRIKSNSIKYEDISTNGIIHKSYLREPYQTYGNLFFAKDMKILSNVTSGEWKYSDKSHHTMIGFRSIQELDEVEYLVNHLLENFKILKMRQ